MSFVEHLGHTKTPVEKSVLEEQLKSVQEHLQPTFLHLIALMPLHKNTKLFLKERGVHKNPKKAIELLYKYCQENNRPSFFFAPFFSTLELCKDKRQFMEEFLSYPFDQRYKRDLMHRICDFCFFYQHHDKRMFLTDIELINIKSLDQLHKAFFKKIEPFTIKGNERHLVLESNKSPKTKIILSNYLDSHYTLQYLWDKCVNTTDFKKIYSNTSAIMLFNHVLYHTDSWTLKKSALKDFISQDHVSVSKLYAFLDKEDEELEILKNHNPKEEDLPYMNGNLKTLEVKDLSFLEKSKNFQDSLKCFINRYNLGYSTRRLLMKLLLKHKKSLYNFLKDESDTIWYAMTSRRVYNYPLDKDLSLYFYMLYKEEILNPKEESFSLKHLSSEKSLHSLLLGPMLKYQLMVRSKIESGQRSQQSKEEVLENITRLRSNILDQKETPREKERLHAIFNK